MDEKTQKIIKRAQKFAARGDFINDLKLLNPVAQKGNLAAKMLCIDLHFEHYMPREAMIQARAIVKRKPKHLMARLRLAEGQLMMGLLQDARKTLPDHAPPGEKLRYQAVKDRINLQTIRMKAYKLWVLGHYDKSRALYHRSHAEERRMRDTYRALLDVDPACPHIWAALMDATGNYHSAHALINQGLPSHEGLVDAFIALVAGRSDHPVRKYRHVTAMTFWQMRNWPIKKDIVATLPPRPRKYQPSNFGVEKNPLQRVQPYPRHIIKLKEATAYDGGNYMLMRTPDGLAPWLQEGVWGTYVQHHVGAIIPGNFGYFNGNGLGTILCTLPAPTLRIEEPVVVLGYWNNHGHFLHDIMPQLEDAEAVLGKDFKILALSSLIPSIKQALARAGYGPKRIITLPARRVAIVAEAYCLTPRTSVERFRRFTTPISMMEKQDFFHYDMALDEGGLRFARERLMPAASLPQKAPHRKIYLSRLGTRRRAENEADVEKMLAALGFEILLPDKLTLAEQINIFYTAKLVVGLEGASLANMLFMQPDTSVLVLRSTAWGWLINCFDELARVFKINYATMDFQGRIMPLDKLRAWANLYKD